LRREIEDTRDHLGDTLDAIGDRVSPGRIVERKKNRARQSVDQVRHRVMGAAPSKPSMPSMPDVSGSASGAMSAVGDTARSAGAAVRHAPEAMSGGAQGNPLVAGGLAFGLGLLVASLLPTTEAEASVADGVVEPLKAQATEIGKEVGSTVKESAAQAGEEVKTAASEAASTVKDEAAGAAQDVKDKASEAAGEVTSTAQGSKERVAGS
jgi:hypothetical protein